MRKSNRKEEIRMIYNGPGPTYFGVGPNNIGNNPYYNNIPGYMPGYYNGNYDMYNPYYYQQIQQKQYEEYCEQQKIQQCISNRLTEVAYNCKGISTEYISKDYKYNDDQLRDIQIYNQNKAKMAQIGTCYRVAKNNKNYITCAKMRQMNIDRNVKDHDDKLMSSKADLFEYMENGYKLTVDIAERRRIQREENLRQYYNQNSYKQLLSMHNNIVGYQNNYDNIQPITIDDMSVSLPSHLATNAEYKARRSEFMRKLMEKARY